MGIRICTDCGTPKAQDAFDPCKRLKGGYFLQCRECRIARRPAEKNCSRCGNTKPIGLFSSIGTKCKACLAELQCARYHAAPELHRERNKVDRDSHKDREKQKSKAYRDRNRGSIAAKKKAYNKANRERLVTKKRAYYEANREKILEQQRAYLEANRDEISARNRARRKANQDAIRARDRARYASMSPEQRAAFDIYQRKYREQHREALNAARKALYAKNRPAILARNRGKYGDDKDYREKQRSWHRAAWASLNDSLVRAYVAKSIGASSKDIPDVLVELQRDKLVLTRALREFKKTVSTTTE